MYVCPKFYANILSVCGTPDHNCSALNIPSSMFKFEREYIALIQWYCAYCLTQTQELII